ncbi:hypothetical protein GCM10011369_17360 [Neiella marina]|uniref:Uncharacterized protein n=1 Tax=Neiella marina TaxID=508461 RepID=A0A8J2U4S8_9GAMM|nr:hypothetical protein [Neiella marina]GGA76005.1 hypothetical protein GCM10011369_17360 [Neiella marina]
MNQLGSSGSFAFAITTALSLSACNTALASDTEVTDVPCQQVSTTANDSGLADSVELALTDAGLQLNPHVLL